MLLARVVRGAGTDHGAAREGGRAPGPAAFTGVQQVEDALPARRLARWRLVGDPGVVLTATFLAARCKTSIRWSCPGRAVGAGHGGGRRERAGHAVSSLDADAGAGFAIWGRIRDRPGCASRAGSGGWSWPPSAAQAAVVNVLPEPVGGGWRCRVLARMAVALAFPRRRGSRLRGKVPPQSAMNSTWTSARPSLPRARHQGLAAALFLSRFLGGGAGTGASSPRLAASMMAWARSKSGWPAHYARSAGGGWLLRTGAGLVRGRRSPVKPGSVRRVCTASQVRSAAGPAGAHVKTGPARPAAGGPSRTMAGLAGSGPQTAAAAVMAAAMAGSQDGSSAPAAQEAGSPAAVTTSPVTPGPGAARGHGGANTRSPRRRYRRSMSPSRVAARRASKMRSRRRDWMRAATASAWISAGAPGGGRSPSRSRRLSGRQRRPRLRRGAASRSHWAVTQVQGQAGSM